MLDDMLASDHVLTRGKKSGINADLHVYTHESIADSVHSEGKVHVSSLSIKTSDSIADLAPENSSYKLPTNPLALPPSPFLSMRNTLSKRSLISPRTNDTASSNEIGSPEVRLRSSSKIARRVSFSDGGDGGPILSARKTLLNQISSKGIAYNSEESSPSMSYPTVPTKISLGIKAEKDPIQEFASGNCESLNGDFDQEICLSKNYLDYFPLLTQEILLFYTTSLIRSLALDSAKVFQIYFIFIQHMRFLISQVRALLRIELSTYLTAIMAVFNELCPRPIFISGPPLLPCYLYASPRKRGQKIMKKLSKYSRKLYNMVGRAIPEPDVVEERQVETEGNPRNASNANIHSNNIDNVDNEMVMYNSVVYSQMSIFKSVRKKITKVADQMKETIGLSTGGNITIEEILERELLDDAGGPQSPHSVDHNIHTDRSDLTNIYNIGIHPDSPMKKLKNELLFPDTAEAGKYEENDKNFSNQKVSRSTQSKDDAEYCLQAAWSSTCKVLDFDSPRYGLSKASWMLLILSRFAIEETIHLIQLDPVHLGIFEPDLIPHKSVIREEMAKQRANSLK